MKVSLMLSMAEALGWVSQVVAEEQAAPTVFGSIRVQQEALNNGKDDGLRVGQASVGVKGALAYDGIKAIYEVEA
ncbi:MAG: hypothetical protein R3E95_06435 [Thiolinea sp.]